MADNAVQFNDLLDENVMVKTEINNDDKNNVDDLDNNNDSNSNDDSSNTDVNSEDDKTNQQVGKSDEDQNDDSDLNLSNQLFSLIGIEEKDELKTGSIEEIAEVIKKHTAKYEEKLNLYESDEELKELIDWKSKGGSIQTFKEAPKRIDYKNIELSEDNVEYGVKIATHILQKEGRDQEEIDDLIAYYKDNGKLLSFNKKGLEKLDALNEKEVNDFKEQQEKEFNNQQELINKAWKDVETTLKSGKLNSFEIPKSDLDSFSKAVLPDEKGNSQIIQKRNSLTIQQQLLMDYIIFKDFKIDGDLSKLASLKEKVQQNNKIGLSKVLKTTSSDNKEKIENTKDIDDLFKIKKY